MDHHIRVMYLILFISYAQMPLTKPWLTYPVKLGLNFVLSLHHIQFMCMRAVKAWMSLHLCVGFIKPSLLDNAVSTRISSKSSYFCGCSWALTSIKPSALFFAVPWHIQGLRQWFYVQELQKAHWQWFVVPCCQSVVETQ